MLRYQDKLAKFYASEFLIKHGKKIEDFQADKDVFGVVTPESAKTLAHTKYELLNTFFTHHKQENLKVGNSKTKV
jgi:hypothetical protein